MSYRCVFISITITISLAVENILVDEFDVICAVLSYFTLTKTTGSHFGGHLGFKDGQRSENTRYTSV